MTIAETTPCGLDGLAHRELLDDTRHRDSQYLPQGKTRDQCTALRLTYTLRDTQTGEERVCIYDSNPHTKGMDHGAVGHIEFFFTEGNFACDCNRALEWARAKGETEPEDRPCSQSPRYRIVAPDWLAAADEERNR